MTTIKFQGNPINTCGNLPCVNTTLPNFTLTNKELNDVTLDSFKGKRKIISIVPSLDTGTCAASARQFNSQAASLPETVILTVSADLPFAQGRFCELEGINNVVALSSFRSNFAKEYGVELIDSPLTGLCARAVIVTDSNDKIIYSSFVEELTEEPDYKAIMAILQA